MTKHSKICLSLGSNKERPIRPDGGNYYPLGFDNTKDQEIDVNGWKNDENWKGINGIMQHWYGPRDGTY